jgi:uncharacterized protein (DUF488 family)
VSIELHTKADPSTIWTIGHSDRSLEIFLALLHHHGVSLVVDVRKMPRSRHNPQFNQDTFPGALADTGVGYVYMPGLGGMRRPQPDSPNMAWKNTSFRGYADYMLTPEFDQSIREMLEHARNQRAALTCAEAVPWRCHRSLIADALVARGISVVHILSAIQTQPHTLRPWAEVRGNRVTYPLHGDVSQQPAGESGQPAAQ